MLSEAQEWEPIQLKHVEVSKSRGEIAVKTFANTC